MRLGKPKHSRSRLSLAERRAAEARQAPAAQERVPRGRQEEASPQKQSSGPSLLQTIFQRFGVLVLLFVAVASLVNILSLSPHSKVQPLDADQSREFIRDEAVYQAAADKLLAKSLLNRNKLTIDSNGLSRDLERQFPELASVSMTVPLLAHRPLVYIQPAQPVVIISGTSGSFALDKTGKAIQPTAALSSSVQSRLPKITDQSGMELRKNQQALSSDDIEFILTVVSQLRAKGLTVTDMSLPPSAAQLDVRIKDQPYYVKFNLQGRDARRQAGTYLATKAQLDRSKVTPAQYIDVRVEGRAYYQ